MPRQGPGLISMLWWTLRGLDLEVALVRIVKLLSFNLAEVVPGLEVGPGLEVLRRVDSPAQTALPPAGPAKAARLAMEPLIPSLHYMTPVTIRLSLCSDQHCLHLSAEDIMHRISS